MLQLKFREPIGDRFFACTFFTLLTVLVIIGIRTAEDYGITWDEKMQYIIGKTGLQFFEGAPWMEFQGKEHFKYFGPTFEILLAYLQKVLGYSASQDIFTMRHFMTFLSYIFGTFFLYRIGLSWWKNPRWALLGCLFFVLSPRIYGHAFYNSKDIPALAMFITCIWTLMRTMQHQRKRDVAIHSFACAILITIRLTGIFMLPLTIAVFATQLVKKNVDRQCVKKSLIHGLLFASLVAMFTVMLWPYLWENPIEHFLKAYSFMSERAFGSYFLGTFRTTFLWYWVPLWILITTPKITSLLFFIGTGGLLWRFMNHPKAMLAHDYKSLIILAWFFGPLSSVILMRAGMYDDWRHMFFIYPAFALLATEGSRVLHNFACQNAKPAIMLMAIWFVIAGQSLSTLVWMVQNHPYQSLYFSIPSRLVEGKFELDYWGLSMRDGMKWVLEHDQSKLISIYPSSSTGWSAHNLLAPELRSRLVILKDPESAMYIVDNFRGNDYKKKFSVLPKLHSLAVNGLEIMAVYKNPNPDPSFLIPELVFLPHVVVFTM